jgi:hypothetical protein
MLSSGGGEASGCVWVVPVESFSSSSSHPLPSKKAAKAIAAAINTTMLINPKVFQPLFSSAAIWGLPLVAR